MDQMNGFGKHLEESMEDSTGRVDIDLVQNQSHGSKPSERESNTEEASVSKPKEISIPKEEKKTDAEESDVRDDESKGEAEKSVENVKSKPKSPNHKIRKLRQQLRQYRRIMKDLEAELHQLKDKKLLVSDVLTLLKKQIDPRFHF